jgi:hypothetical protein
MKLTIVKRFTLVMLLALLVPNLSSCASLQYWPANQARVLDADTEMPIAGAVVVAMWEGDIPAWVDFRSTCYHIESAVSDSDGRFKIPAYSEIKGHMINDKIVNWIVYAKGYRYSSRNSGGDYTKSGVYWMEKDDRKGSERLEYLTQLRRSSKCPDAGDSDKYRLNYIKALLDEALGLEVQKGDEGQIESLRYAYDDLRYGGEEADKRLQERTNE